MFGLGGLVFGYMVLFFLAGLGLVFISGAIIALFLKIIGMTSGRAVLWGFGVPLAGFGVVGLAGFVHLQAANKTPTPIYIDYPAGGTENDGK